ncbi:MAG: trimethylamine methyltransferase family protein, partial [Pseudomonadota bacterium]
MARRARARRGALETHGTVAPSPYICRRLPFFDVLDEETVDKLERQVDWIFENVGIDFRDDPEALRIWKEAGAEIDDCRVRADA